MTRAAALLGCSLLSCLAFASGASAAPGPVLAGAAQVDGTYNVGSSAGQYASTRDGGYGDVDPHAQSVKNKASYGVQSRESVRALVVKGGDGTYAAIVSDDHYIPQDGLQKRTAQLASAATGGALNATNITLSVTHNHSSPSYSSFNPGVWTFQDAFDFRFFDYYARQNAAALVEAFNNLHKVRVSATASYFDKIQRSPLGAGTADDGAPAGFTDSYADHDLSVIRFENIDDPANPRGLSTLVNLGQHPEFLNGYDLITSEFPGAMERMVDRTVGGITIFTQNATGNSEIEKEKYHPVSERAAFDHTQYNQMEWAARQLADGVIANVRDIEAQTPNADDTEHFGMASYQDRFVEWVSEFEVGVEDRWFPGPVSHPYPGVNSCRTDALLSGNIRVGTAADCTELYQVPLGDVAITTDTFEELGFPFPENISTPSHGALQDTFGVHMQAIRLGDILLTVCSCEQWTDQAYNIKTRTDQITGNEWLGYDAVDPPKADDKEWKDNFCTQVGDGTYAPDGSGPGTWTCATSGATKLSDRVIQQMRSRTLNDAAGWDEPTCAELGCGAQAESEPVALDKIRGNYTHDDTTVRGGTNQTQDYADRYGYKMVVTVSMSNDYNGYIATYRDYMGRDHYRKALTGWGPHSSDFFATRLTRMGHALKGDADSKQLIDRETDPAVAAQVAPEYAHAAARELADQAHEEAKVRSIGEAASAAVKAYDATLPEKDGNGAPGDYRQPQDIERFDASTFTWVGGNNYTDQPLVTVERHTPEGWVVFADQSGEVPVSLAYPGGKAEWDENAPQQGATGLAGYRLGGQTWKWTATFEAMVNRFELVDPDGKAYRATPAGTYRFHVIGERRSGYKDIRYEVYSDTFKVGVWHGITIEDVAVAGDRHVTFAAGPSHQQTESRIRGTDRPPLPGNATAFTIGPVDFPDFAADQAAQGFRFLTKQRGYSANTPEDAQHYCLDCRFRDWLDATSDLTATVTFHTGGGQEHVEKVQANDDGEFRTVRALGNGESADIIIEDAWGNRTAAPAHVG